MEMQERLLQAVQQQRMQQQQQQQQQQGYFGAHPAASRAGHHYVDPRGQVHAPAQPRKPSFNSHNDDLREQSRREAIAAAQRGHLRRSPSPEPQAFEQARSQALPFERRSNRLSFNGAAGDHLAERAMARKLSGSTQSRPNSADWAHPVPQSVLGHTRGQSSISSNASGQSVILSDERRELFSPHGPTIFLSSPGETFPIATSCANTFANSSSDEDSALSSGSDSPTLESGSSSVTSLASSDGASDKFLDMAALGRQLNPVAPSFMPTPAAPTPFVKQRPTARLFSGTAAAKASLTYVVRQPKGPAQEDDMPAENFKGRQRKQALAKLKRRSFTPAA